MVSENPSQLWPPGKRDRSQRKTALVADVAENTRFIRSTCLNETTLFARARLLAGYSRFTPGDFAKSTRGRDAAHLLYLQGTVTF